MKAESAEFLEYLSVLSRRRWYIFLPALVCILVVGLIVSTLPTKYRSSATILIEQQEIPTDLVRSTVTSYADQRVQIIRQRVMTSQNLSAIIGRHDLYSEIRQSRGMNAAVSMLLEELNISTISADVLDPRSGRPASATIAFTIAYDAENPANTQKVVNELVSLFLDENLRERTRTAKEATLFLEQESLKLAEEVSNLEARLASFKEKHGDAIPEMTQVNLQLMQRTEDSLRQVDQEIRSLEVHQIYLESELSKLNPYSSKYSSTGERLLSPEDRLKALEIELLRMQSRYSPNHPDRASIEREINILRAQVTGVNANDLHRRLADQKRKLAELLSRYTENHPEIIRLKRDIQATESALAQSTSTNLQHSLLVPDADNPAYIQMQAQLIGNQSKIDALKQTRIELTERFSQLEDRISEAPKVEREYRLITRDYETALLQYNQVRARSLEASLAESLETERKAERFTLVEPPMLPDQPVSPNRLALAFLGLVFATVVGFTTAAAREFFDNAIYSTNTIYRITSASPLAIIPILQTASDQKRQRIRIILQIVTILTLIALSLTAISIFYMPLDILWHKIIAKISGI